MFQVVRIGFCLLVLSLVPAGSLRAQENQLLDNPKPKTEKPKLLHRVFPFDRLEWSMAFLQAGAEIFDGHETHNYTHRDLARCQGCTEADPLSYAFLGPRPTWPRMTVFGTVEDWASTYLDHRLRASRHRFIRWLGPVSQLTLTSIHVKQGDWVANTPDDCKIGWTEVHFACYSPGSAPSFIVRKR